MIRTITGDIALNELGWCQCHEHLFIEKGKSYEVNNALCMDNIEKSIQELISYAIAGGKAYVDAQPVGCGRIAESMLKASVTTGVRIIGSTGFHKTCFYYHDSFIFHKDDKCLTELFVSEINDGMISSNMDGERRLPAKAGIIKVAVEEGGIFVNRVYEKLFSAAVTAALETGASILAHFEKDTDAFELINYLEQRGVPANKLIACHLDRSIYDIAYHKDLAQAGIYLEYDTINRPHYHDNKKEIQLICEMVSAGYIGNLLFSLDTTNKRLRSYGANMGIDYIKTEFSVQLNESGLGSESLELIMVDNAAKALKIDKKER